MTWEQKVQACQALGEFSLKMRHPGDWYVNQSRVEVSDGHILSGGCVSGAKTPEEAVDKHWDWLTALGSDERIVVNADNLDRRAYRWNGFMWAEQPEGLA